MNDSTTRTILVNGERRTVAFPTHHTLLEVLREELGLTGTKQGCDDGACGTCTVTLNGAMVRACRVSAAKADGKEVLTIEGLGSAEQLHPLQEAFIEADAVQCGFCTPGTIMAAKALLDRNPAPTREQIAKALGSNLCRCTGYVGILDAVARAAAGPVSPASCLPDLPGGQRRLVGRARGRARCAWQRTAPCCPAPC